MKEIQPGIFSQNDNLYTKNQVPGQQVYGESLQDFEGDEYRAWHANRSKVAAAVKNGIDLGVEQSDDVLYLGAASGTTVSHFSDLLVDGFVFGVEYSETVGRDLVKLADSRGNIAPIIGDARKPEDYSDLVPEVEVVFQDISQRDQPEIFIKNAEKFLKDDGIGLIAVKAQSISSSRDPEDVFDEAVEKLEERFEVLDRTRLEPYEKDHLFLKLKKR
ncbi:fibrillarin-like rRNA/tRNA 2'-O-methyltransferase [Candidatus Nanohalovita haloferacivicina]|uniref:fibrillarin-like rRNA/tRNA 2'-O-methyltransferase n=1 Tax=Candidatus Nanohalovita haloferacivicina TaxID=2978046 RepID=UPI00325FD989|nr:Fibrillarin-like pre-rRNA processing protein [Candidatus Nanohalobia archaeon BNXNv]